MFTGKATYQPGPGFVGEDEFEYKICDNDDLCDAALVVVKIVEEGPPIAIDDDTSTDICTPVVIDILFNDYDLDGTVDPATVVIDIDVSHGVTSVDPVTGVVTYVPDLNYFGSDSFSYTVDDDDGATSNVAVVDILVGFKFEPDITY